MYYLIGILCGLIPEVLYFTLFLIYTKKLENKKIKLFLLLAVTYTLLIFIQQYKIVHYIAFIFLVYIILKILYRKKTQITDIFVISISTIYLTLISYVCFKFVKEDLSNYYFISIFNRILLFVPFIFKKHFNILYKKYYNMWNRNDKEKRPIKSLTLRNISLIILNLFICCLNLIIIYLLTKVK